MPTSLKQQIGSGGDFKISSASGPLSVAGGSSGNIITITPPAGKKVMLASLTSISDVQDITITVGSKTVVNSAVIDSGVFYIATTSSGSGLSVANVCPPIIGDVDEQLVVSTQTSTAGQLSYSYCYGD